MEILFRSSGIGNLMIEGRGVVLTELQKTKLEEYKKRNSGDGKPLTDTQKNEFEALLSKENAIILEDALVWLRDEKRIIVISRPLDINGLELAKYLTEYSKVKENKALQLADKIINDCNLYLGANLTNGEIEQYKKLRNEQ